ncbi:MAG: hypothetical protein ACYDH9_00045 [Limisphaerales bacterium]
MSANYSPPTLGFRVGSSFTAALAGWLLWTSVHQVGAATITNVTPVNVTPTSFSILWRTIDSAPAVSVYADAGGGTNLAGQLGIEAFPLHTGNPDLAAGYARRQSQIALRQKTQSLGLMLVRVTGCQPGTTYYYRLTSTPSGSSPIVYPASGPLPGVTTERENTFVVNAQQLIIDVPGVDTGGQLVTLSHPNASHPLAAVVGDGVGTNQVFFNVNDLFVLAGGGNFTPLGTQDFTAEVLGPGQSDTTNRFTLVFGTAFTVAQATNTTLGTEFLALTIGSTVMQTGQTSSVPVICNSGVGVSNLTFVLDVPLGHLTNLLLQALAPEIDPASATVTPQAGTTSLLRLAARSGQTILGAKQLAQLTFTAIPSQPSAFVPLKLLSITAAKPDASLVANLSGQSGRAVVIGAAALLEANRDLDGARSLMLYGKPSSSYAIDYTTNLANPSLWTRWYRIPLPAMSAPIPALDESLNPIFYRAVEFLADPPVLQAMLNPDQTRSLLVYGLPTHQYTVEYATNLSNILAWYPLLDYTLTNSFSYLNVGATNGAVFYRLHKKN